MTEWRRGFLPMFFPFFLPVLETAFCFVLCIGSKSLEENGSKAHHGSGATRQ
ncbi:hypothetical protein SEUBUCD646_0L03620 [Saccharomyces eubayanus]|uniref:Uncharacterized protein n=1 Tax=Saccharomyces eubayanus TaxID=1080349 RepID=A0ABN8VJG0_SACEU|nr:hypothetical protein SEUBUCD650_0L03610 [Saccharomyces eubayanus]CAI1622687.1 hypothetical protein SEUBUCD646_0L03620 [Saccharomyces eubayanus]